MLAAGLRETEQFEFILNKKSCSSYGTAFGLNQRWAVKLTTEDGQSTQ
jgi:hypothetical protein